MEDLNHSLALPVDQDLLRAVAEELKLPLIRIARIAELSPDENRPEADLKQLLAIEHNADLALQLVESYLIGLQLNDTQQSLALEPVSLGSVLNDTAHKLNNIAQEYKIDLEVKTHHRQSLVMANPSAIRAAFLNVGSTLIASQPPPTGSKRQCLTLASDSRSEKILAGIYGNQGVISRSSWQRARELYGRARQPLLSLNVTNGAGFFVADAIFQAMSVTLRPAKRGQQYGLAGELILSQQLKLV